MLVATKPSQLLRIGLPLLIFAISIAIYLPTLQFDFVMDDTRQIEMMQSRFTWDQVPSYFITDVWSYTDRVSANYYRPIFVLWLMLNYQMVGLSHMAWHACAILINAGAALMFYFLALRITSSYAASGISGLIFAVYPVHLEGVAWVSGATEPLWALLVFATLTLFLKGEQESDPKRKRWANRLAPWVFALALFAKETAAAVPVLIFAYLWLFPATESESRSKRVRAAFFAVVPYLQVVVVYFALRFIALGHFSPRTGSWPKRVLVYTFPETVWFYIQDLLWPFRLTIFPPVDPVIHPGLRNFVLPAIGVAIVAGVLLWISLRSRIAAFCSGLMALTIAPALMYRVFPPDDFVHDRYLYVPSAGLCILLGLGVVWLMRSWPIPARVAAVLPLVAILGYFTIRQSEPWSNGMALAHHAAAIAPDHQPAYMLLAGGYMFDEHYDLALPLVMRAHQAHPESVPVCMALGLCHLKLGHWAEAAEQFKLALTGTASNPQGNLCLGMAELEMGDISDAEAHMREAVRLRPQTSVQYRGYRYYLGDLLERKGDYDGALAEYSRELEEYPDEGWVLDRELALRKKMESQKTIR